MNFDASMINGNVSNGPHQRTGNPSSELYLIERRVEALENGTSTALHAVLVHWMKTWTTLVEQLLHTTPEILKDCTRFLWQQLQDFLQNITYRDALTGICVAYLPLHLNRATGGCLPILNTCMVQVPVIVFGSSMSFCILSKLTKSIVRESSNVADRLQNLARDHNVQKRTILIAGGVAVGLGALLGMHYLFHANLSLRDQLTSLTAENRRLSQDMTLSAQSLADARCHARGLATSLGLLQEQCKLSASTSDTSSNSSSERPSWCCPIKGFREHFQSHWKGGCCGNR